jgi:hypothetical protein
MIRVYLQVGKEERLSARLMASAIWLDRYEDGIDLLQFFRIIEFHYPPLFGGVVLVEDAKAGSLLFVKTAAAPRLKGAGAFVFRLLVEIIGVENQRLSFGVEDPAIRFLRLPVTRNVIDLGNIKVPSPHEFADIPVVGKQFLLIANLLLQVAELTMELSDLHRQTFGARLLLRALLPQGIEFRLGFL